VEPVKDEQPAAPLVEIDWTAEVGGERPFVVTAVTLGVRSHIGRRDSERASVSSSPVGQPEMPREGAERQLFDWQIKLAKAFRVPQAIENHVDEGWRHYLAEREGHDPLLAQHPALHHAIVADGDLPMVDRDLAPSVGV
jgi:hypothetical protein